MDETRAWVLGILAILIAGASLFWNVLSGSSGERKKDMSAMNIRLDDVEMAQARMEERLRHLPDKVDRIALDTAETRSDTKVQNVTIHSLAQSMRRVEKRLFKITDDED